MTTPAYSCCGKQILRDGADFAQAATPEAAILITIALGGKHPRQLDRDVLAMKLRDQATTLSDIAAKVSEPARDQLCGVFNTMNQAARELSNG